MKARIHTTGRWPILIQLLYEATCGSFSPQEPNSLLFYHHHHTHEGCNDGTKNPPLKQYFGPLHSIHEVTGGCFVDMLAVTSLFVGATPFFHLTPAVA